MILTICMQDYDGNGFSFKVVPRGGKPGFPDQFGYSVLFWREFSHQQTICSRWFPAKTSARHRANQLSQDILTWVSATRTKGKKENPIGYAMYHQTGAKEETFQEKISRWLDYDERFYRYDDILEIVTELVNNPHRERYSGGLCYPIRIRVRNTVYSLKKIHNCDKLTLTAYNSDPFESVDVGKYSKENMAWIFAAKIADLELYKVVSNGLNCIEALHEEEYDICDRPDCKFVVKKEHIVSEYGFGTYEDFYTLLDNNRKVLCSKPVSYGIPDTSRLFASKIRDILIAKHNKDFVQIDHKTCCDSPLEVLKEIKSIIERMDI